MRLSSEELAALDRHHYVQGYTDEDVRCMPLDQWTVLDKLNEADLVELDNTFFASSGMTYISTTPTGLDLLRRHRDDARRRLQDYQNNAIF